METVSNTAEYTQQLASAASDVQVPPELQSLYDLALKMKDLQEKKEKAEEYLKKVNIVLERLRTTDIPDAMAEANMKTVTFTGVGRIQLAADVYVSYADHKEEAFSWMTENGYSNVVQETMNASTVKAIFRKMLKEGKPVPDTIFRITPFTRASIVRV